MAIGMTVVAYEPRHRAEQRRLSRAALRTLHAAEIVVAVVVIGLLSLLAVGKLVFGLGLSPVLTGSMAPAYAPGDAVVTRSVDASSLEVGDVAIVKAPGEKTAYAHRIADMRNVDGKLVLTTQGDANPAPDAWRTEVTGDEITTVVASVPYLGHPMTWVGDPRTRALGIAVLGLLLTGMGVRSILAGPARRHVSPSPLSGTPSRT